MLFSKKSEDKACRPMCQICFNSGAEPMIYGRFKEQIGDRRKGTLAKKTQSYWKITSFLGYFKKTLILN